MDEITQNFPQTTINILKVDKSKPSFHVKPISELKIQALINSLKSSTAKDIYGMDCKMLQSLEKHLAYPITITINQSVLQRIFPTA